jgi:hypothetical protein
MQTATSVSPFRITSHYTPSDIENGTNIVSHITHLIDSYFVWVGGTIEKPDQLQTSPPQAAGGSLADDDINKQGPFPESRSVEALVSQAMQGGSLAKDFACAMPSKQVSRIFDTTKP